MNTICLQTSNTIINNYTPTNVYYNLRVTVTYCTRIYNVLLILIVVPILITYNHNDSIRIIITVSKTDY